MDEKQEIQGRFLTKGFLFCFVECESKVSWRGYSQSVESNLNRMNIPDYPKNEHGKTYGSAADASSPETRPDLISAVGVDGTKGYILKKDIDGIQPKSPEEAITKQNNTLPGGRDILLYDVDGETVIGMFHVGGSK